MSEDTLCPISGHEMKFWLYMPIDCRTGRAIKCNQVYKCPECDYAAVVPRPDISEVASFYDLPKYYTQGESHQTESGKISIFDKLRVHIAWRFDWGTEMNAEWIDQLLNNQPRDICELGCGSGNLLQMLCDKGHKVYGVEPDLKAIAYKRELNIYTGTAENIPEPVKSKQFDVVIIKHVLEHCLDPLIALANAYSLLRPGGYLICETPNNLAKGLEFMGVTWEMLDIPRHLNFFNPSNLQEICVNSGFKIEKVIFRGYCRQFSNRWINTEAEIYDRIAKAMVNPSLFARKNSKITAWKLLISTLLASDEKKYDSVAVIARK